MTITEIDKSDVCDTTVMRELRKLVSLINTNVVDGLNEELDEIESTLIPETAETVASEVYGNYNVSLLASQVKALASAVNNLQDVQTIVDGGNYGEGLYKLDGDVELTSTLSFTSNYVLFLNGYTLTGNIISRYNGCVIGEGVIYGHIYHYNYGSFYVVGTEFHVSGESKPCIYNYSDISDTNPMIFISDCTFYNDYTWLNLKWGRVIVENCEFNGEGVSYLESDGITFNTVTYGLISNCTLNCPARRLYFTSDSSSGDVEIVDCTYEGDGISHYSDLYVPVYCSSLNTFTLIRCVFNNVVSETVLCLDSSTTYKFIAIDCASNSCSCTKLFQGISTHPSFVLSWTDSDSSVSSTSGEITATYAYDIGDLTNSGTTLS